MPGPIVIDGQVKTLKLDYEKQHVPGSNITNGNYKPYHETDGKTSSLGKLNLTRTFIAIFMTSCQVPGLAMSVQGTIIVGSINSKHNYCKERILRK